MTKEEQMKVIAAFAAMSIAVVGLTASGSASPGTERRCRAIGPLPRAAAAGEATLFGHIKSLRRTGFRYRMKFDPALLLSGLPAERAAFEDTGSPDVPNDYYIVDESHRLLTYVVPADAKATVVRLGQGVCSGAVNVAKLAQIVAKGTGFPFWIRVSRRYPSPVLSLDQQYRP
jgi:hypothetical protein